jgi:hypothetical protein
MYSCPAEWYRNANATVAAFFLITNGAALVAASSNPSDPLAGSVVRDTTVSLPIAAFALALSGVTWLRPRLLLTALRIQTIGLVLLSAYLALGAIAQFASVTHESQDFLWSVGFFTLLLFYTAVSAVRFALTESLHSNPSVFYVPAVVAALAAVFDVSVFLHVLV